MIDHNGSQCCYCTPGFVCSMAEASARGVSGDPAAVADQLCGNLCRGTGDRPIREALLATPETALPKSATETCPSLPGYERPSTLAEALAPKAANPEASYIAPATEQLVLINKRQLRYETLISLEQIDELLRIETSDAVWSIGAAAPLTDIEAALGGEFPALDQAMRLFASRQIRHRATLGGNLVTVSPIGDCPPVNKVGPRSIPHGGPPD